MAAALLQSNPTLGNQLAVHPSIEVRSSGALKVSTDLALPSPSSTPSAGSHAGAAGITLRAAGSLTVEGGIASGFAGDAVDGARGGTIRLAGGADLAAAQAGAVTGSAGDVLIGRAPALGDASAPSVAVRTTTGSIDIRAARDIRLLNDGATVYTTGRPDLPAGVTMDSLANGNLADPAVSPLLDGGGSIRLVAGQDVSGIGLSSTDPYFTSWWWRAEPQVGGPSLWWSRYDLFRQGIATFGGGDLRVDAGRDLVNLHAATATSGVAAEADPVTRYGGGSIEASAGRDVVNGLLYAGGSRLDLTAGGAIGADAARGGWQEQGVQLAYETTAIRVQAAGSVELASVRNAGYTARGDGNEASEMQQVIGGLDAGSSLLVQSASGSIAYRGLDQPHTDFNTTLPGRIGSLLPGSVSFAAPNGGMAVANILVRPTADGVLQFLARDQVTVSSLDVSATHPVERTAVASMEALNLGLSAQENPIEFFSDQGGADRSDRSPLRVVSESGDLAIAGGISSARPVRLIAGNDLKLGTNGFVVVQHQPQRLGADGTPLGAVSELSLVQAGRDIASVATTEVNASRIDIAGPGDLVLLAGRDVNLGVSSGISSTGNTTNSAVLPALGANVTVIAGLRADGSDMLGATREGYALVGGSTLVDHAGALYALLSRAADPASAAAAFDARPLDDQLAAVASLLGAAGWDAARIAYVRGLPKQGESSDAAALQAFDALPDWQRRLAVGTMLTRRFGGEPVADRTTFIAGLAAAATDKAMQEANARFLAYVDAVAPSAPGADTTPAQRLADALVRFESLPLERQAAWLNRRLIDDLRTYGRLAAGLFADERSAAYARGYLSIDALFPGDAARQGDVLLPTSQIRTLQQADITVMAPGGGVNAGELAGSTSRAASSLGIVTVGGGDISAFIRDDFAVNQSRVFSLKQGDILLWSSDGNIDAGRGAKTVTGAPAPVLRIDAQGRLSLDASGSFSGSGIAVLDTSSSLDLYAPQGEINAGEAGIKSVGNGYFGALAFRGADNLSVGGTAVGAPPTPPPTGATAGHASAGNAVAAGAKATTDESDDDKRRKRRARRNLLLDFLGFGSDRS